MLRRSALGLPADDYSGAAVMIYSSLLIVRVGIATVLTVTDHDGRSEVLSYSVPGACQ